jgi:alanine racemase
MSQLGPSFTARPTLRIDLGAVKANYKAIQKRVGAVKVAACVKADAYGLGAERVGRALYGAGCRNYFVATAGEGKILRASIGDNASIYVLNGPAPRDLSLFFGSRLKPVINSLVQARIWADAVGTVKSAPYSVLHVDTGINRLGMTEFEIFCKNRDLRDSINYEFLMSHLACAPNKDHPLNGAQLAKFRKLTARLPIGPMTLANTAGIYLGKKYHFDMVRPGIGLYGGCATTDPKQEVSRPVVSLMAPVLQVRSITAGDSVGYDSQFTAKADMTLATVGAGYADGIPVAASGAGERSAFQAIMKSRQVPIVGRVSMDLTVLDVTGLGKPPRVGEWAEFLGENLQPNAEAAKTNNYELLVRLGQRCRREYS